MKKAIILIVLFVFPALAIFFLASGEHHFTTLPYYGEGIPYDTVINGEAVVDTHHFQVPPFAFTNQNGETITQADVQGEPYVAHFFFTSCPTICPPMTNQLKRALFELKDVKSFRVLSHTVDPKHDTLQALQAYAEKYYADTTRWHFLRGDADYTYNVGAEGYMLASKQEPNAPGGFLHSEYVALVDRNGHIRGYYDATNTDEIDRLIAEVRLLYKEELVNTKASQEAASR